jgi:hypothetical protein
MENNKWLIEIGLNTLKKAGQLKEAEMFLAECSKPNANVNQLLKKYCHHFTRTLWISHNQ